MKPPRITPAEIYRVLLQREIEFPEDSVKYKSLLTVNPRELCRGIMGSPEFRGLWGFGRDPLPGLTVMTDAPGLRYWFRLRDRMLGHVLARNAYEPEITALVKRIVKPDMTVLDIGANLGYFTVLMGAIGCRVHAFEPFPGNFELLERNIAENRLTTVTAHRVAVHCETRSGKLFYRVDEPNENFGSMFSSSLEQPPHLSSIDVDYVALDDYLADLPALGFVKMDVEGAEVFALTGMRRLLERCRPVLIVELNEQALVGANQHSPEQLLDTLKELRYRILDAGTQLPYRLPADREKFALANLLCHPV
jgi:FkbM family methyltransferase